MTRLTACLAAFAIALASAQGCGAQPAAADSGGSIGDICTRIVGLSPGERHYAACVDSLTRSAAAQHRGEDLDEARQACLAQGAAPHSSALAQCELSAADAARATPPHWDGPGAAVPGGRRSYFEVSRQTGFERDRMACAQLGLEPVNPSFDQCAADLRASLAQASMPMM
jgi:hypothetical protein